MGFKHKDKIPLQQSAIPLHKQLHSQIQGHRDNLAGGCE
jgi:hypothetical protein